MSFFFRYLKYKLKTILLLVFFAVLFGVSFALYHLPLKPIIYPTALAFALGIVFLIIDYLKVKEKHNELEKLKTLSAKILEDFPDDVYVTDSDFREITESVRSQFRSFAECEGAKYQSMIDYYTVWVHQIKTPIASMRLNLQNEDSPLSRKLQNDLNRIEGYVNMVLTYLRLDSESTDYVITHFPLDTLLKTSIKKFSGEFIGKRLGMKFSSTGLTVLSDEKWLSFVIEQILSNAVKYTESGGVKIYAEDGVLCIRDSGIGISAEDLPRIFENGYTGFNGRSRKKATGIGLYLCKRICDKLNHRIWAESEPGVGTTIKLDLNTRERTVE